MTSPAAAPVRSHRRRRAWWFGVAALAVIAVPLAANGLFSSAFSNVSDNLNRVPAALVDNDKLITTTAADGTTSTIFAGRGLVTALTAPDQAGFDWNVTNSADAAAGLADGTYYAVLTIPEDFSAKVNTLSSNTPVQSAVDITTDESHGYLSGVVAGTVASALKAGFGQTITQQVLSGVYSSFGTIGSSFTTAAGGAGSLASGASTLGSGLTQLATGASSAADGAAKLSTGVSQYTDGVDTLAGGISSLDAGAGDLSGLSSGLSRYTDGVSTLSQGFGSLSPGILGAIASNPNLTDAQKAQLSGGFSTLTAGLDTAASSGSELSSQASSGVDSLQNGIAQLDSGASRLSGGSGALRSGASDLAGGLTTLASGTQQSADGAAQLATGATQLQTGLQSGADKLAANTAADPAAAAKVASDPIAVNVRSQNGGGGIGQVIAILLIPAGLWMGALAVFLFLHPLKAAVLASSASTGRLVGRVFGRASGFAVLQALLVVGYLHLSLGAAWSSLPATLGFSLLIALAFTAFHQFLTLAFGRVGAVISLILFAIQLATTAGVYPVQLLAGPYQFISSISPLAYAVSGVQGILAGGAAGPVWASVAVLAILLLVSLLASGVAMARRRNPIRTGWLLVGASAREMRAPREAGRVSAPAGAISPEVV